MHGLRYTRLPDWFLAFDVYDREAGQFWSVDRRNELLARVAATANPELGRGRFDVEGLKRRLGDSRLTGGPAEGLYVRREEGGRVIARAKMVRAEFVQSLDEHWSKRGVEENQLEEIRRHRDWH